MENEGFDIGSALPEVPALAAKIKIVGVGGGGGNAANRMYNANIPGVDFIICNSDQQDLAKSPIPTKIRMGEGLGCGSNSEKGEQYAKACTAQIENALDGAQMVFITAGMGGGTGTGAAPVIAEIAKQKGILTVAIVTLPFKFEGSKRYDNAIHGIEALSQNVDSILVINNQSLRELYGDLPMRKSFAKADEILSVGTKAIVEVMQRTGFINVDFEDVRAVMEDSGVAVMASGEASGEERAFQAIERTLESPLLNKADIRGAKKILLNISTNEDNEITGDEMEIITEQIRQHASTDVDITLGYMCEAPESGEEIKITLIATGFEISDIPEFQKPEPKKVIMYGGGNQTAAATQPIVNPNGQTELFSNTELSQTSNNTSLDYEKLRGASDSEFEDYKNMPAWKRREMQSKQQSQPQTDTAVFDRIQGSTPSQFSIENNAKGIILGDNKYLNHNVD